MGNTTSSIIKGDMRMKNIKEIGDFFINLNEYEIGRASCRERVLRLV